jgi:hypothetical protein
MLHMPEFLEKEAATGGLNPHRMKLPHNNTHLWGRDLWYYLNKVADETPAWYGRFIAFPDRPGMSQGLKHCRTLSILVLN